MIQPPFLSHKRKNLDLVTLLDRALVELGVGAWRDLRSLDIGSNTPQSIRTAINERTGGFIWLGTRESLESKVICALEVPAALRKRRRASEYPFVPLFVDFEPDYALVKSSFGRWPLNRLRAREVLDANGIVRSKDDTAEDFMFEAACRYQRACLNRLAAAGRPIALHFTSGRRPAKEADLALDWRDLLDNGWPVDGSSIERISDVLRCTGRSIQDSGIDGLAVCCDLRLPLAALVGWELNADSVADVFSVQDFGEDNEVCVSDRTAARLEFQTKRADLGTSGPTVIAVSVCSEFRATAERYATEIGAGSLTRIHEPNRLNSEGVKSLAAQVRKLLSEANDKGVAKHLLLLGPSSLAFRIGREARGTGRTLMPFWDQSDGYNGHVVIGGTSDEIHEVVVRKQS